MVSGRFISDSELFIINKFKAGTLSSHCEVTNIYVPTGAHNVLPNRLVDRRLRKIVIRPTSAGRFFRKWLSQCSGTIWGKREAKGEDFLHNILYQTYRGELVWVAKVKTHYKSDWRSSFCTQFNLWYSMKTIMKPLVSSRCGQCFFRFTIYDLRFILWIVHVFVWLLD